MASRNRSSSSPAAPARVAAAGQSSHRLPTRGEKRELDTGPGTSSQSGSKRSKMAAEGSGRGKQPRLEDEAGCETAEEVCPITDKDTKPFRLMDMPPEIRIEIYRACLTRPFDVLLSREAKPVEQEKERAELRENDEPLRDLLVGDEDRHFSRIVSRFDQGDEVDDAGVFASSAPASNNNDARSGLIRNHSSDLVMVPMPRYNLRANGAPHSTTNNASSDGSNGSNGSSSSSSTRPNRRRSVRTINPPRGGRRTPATSTPPRAPRPQDVDPLLVNLMRTSKLVYKESRAILYGENKFLLDLDTAQPTLAALHQRSRGQIRDLRVTIPTHNEILERFSEVVRLSLRYCWRLRRFVIHTPFVLPGADGSSTSGNTTVYANAFDILRWLPRQCEVVLEGTVCEEIRQVVEKNSNLARSLDELAYARRQLISNDAQRLPVI